ncbi:MULTISPECIES: hypothetical protein [Methylobacterium]|uniref:Ribbon-helix-helix protein CopG domain-containing protein n=1 Tax=Methylobacterium isbiliense TaxID=315478 RepID=A0ABQ4SKD9_9HYPH|nr:MULTISPECIES: hypothetical protein [Methylobacterium]MBY0298525.1 hypothetical protein [Methylobacterium sp.]MDN3627630.1 hypothetical protein [Methylobacterium isbiliense]GJE02210.1 hypothetical protein GMJLKIPL_4154 [Methylobacterium isbiliense]
MGRPSIAKVAALGLVRRDAQALEAGRDRTPTRDDVIGPERDDVIASPREDAPRAAAAVAASRPARADAARREPPLPHASLYVHPRVLRALKLVALEAGVKQQDVLREAVRRHLAEKGHPFDDLTAGT